jgi:hypothetical protein
MSRLKVALVGPFVEFLFPGGLFGGDGGGALRLARVAGQGAAGQALAQRDGGGLGVAADADRDLLHQAQHLVVGVDLDDLGPDRPVVHAVLRQGAEGAEAGAQRDDHVGLRHQLHRRLRALVAERAAPQRVAGGEGVVVQIAVYHRRAEALGQRLAFLDAVGHHYAAAGDDHRELRRGQQFGRLVEALFAAGAAIEVRGLGDLAGDVAVEVVARDVELGRAHFVHGAVEAAAGEFGHALGIVDVALVLGEFLEHRQLVGFLEAAEAHAHGAGFGGDDHHRAVRPVGGGDGRDAVADAGAVLADDHAVAARDAGIAVGHVAGALLVHHRDQADAGRGEDVHRVHEGRAHDAEHVGHAVGDHGFDEGFGRGHAGRAFGHLAIVGRAHLMIS